MGFLVQDISRKVSAPSHTLIQQTQVWKAIPELSHRKLDTARSISTLARVKVFPWSMLSQTANNSRCSSIREAMRWRYCDRCEGGVADHAGKAASAALTAWSICSGVLFGMHAKWRPVLGFIESIQSWG